MPFLINCSNVTIEMGANHELIIILLVTLSGEEVHRLYNLGIACFLAIRWAQVSAVATGWLCGPQDGCLICKMGMMWDLPPHGMEISLHVLCTIERAVPAT